MGGLPWIPLDVAFPGSRKALALSIATQQPLAWAYVVRLWCWAAQHAADGRIEGPDAVSVIEHAAGWDKTPGALVGAMTAAHIRLLDETSAGFAIHDWSEHCGAHVEKRERDKTRMRRAREANRSRTVHEPNAHVRGESKSKSESEIYKKQQAAADEDAPLPKAPWEAFRDALADRMAVPREWMRLARPDEAQATREMISAEVTRLGLARAVEVAAEAGFKAKSKPRWLRYFLGALQDASRHRVEQDGWQGESPAAPGTEAWPEPSPEQIAEWERQAREDLGGRA